MEIFSYLEKYDYEQVFFCQDKHSGLKAIIAIHDTTLGPALGGTRMWKYDSEAEAIEDALRLARGMTYKNAAAGLDLGGGKTVIIGDPKQDKNPEMFRAFGRYIQSLQGRYITAEDVGTNESDMDQIALETEYVTGLSSYSGAAGNPSPVTALGIYQGMKATAKEALGTASLEGKVIAVQGVGSVAYSLCELLHKEGAELVVTDINKESVKRAQDDFGATVVDPDDIYDVECDIYAPCALGATINDQTIPRLKAKAVAGSANNQLQQHKHGDILHEKGILYAPDYVINAGGVINVADELVGYNRNRALQNVQRIYQNLEQVFTISNRDGIPTHVAADRLAEERIQAKLKSRNQFMTNERNILTRRQ